MPLKQWFQTYKIKILVGCFVFCMGGGYLFYQYQYYKLEPIGCNYFKNKEAVYYLAIPYRIGLFSSGSRMNSKPQIKKLFESKIYSENLNNWQDHKTVRIDKESFSLISEDSCHFFKDKVHVYAYFKFCEGSLPTQNNEMVLNNNNQSRRSDFLLTKHDIFSKINPFTIANAQGSMNSLYGYNVISEADPMTFQYLGKGYSKDKLHVFHFCQILPDADPKTFQIPNKE